MSVPFLREAAEVLFLNNCALYAFDFLKEGHCSLQARQGSAHAQRSPGA
jgi:hypothetical protein